LNHNYTNTKMLPTRQNQLFKVFELPCFGPYLDASSILAMTNIGCSLCLHDWNPRFKGNKLLLCKMKVRTWTYKSLSKLLNNCLSVKNIWLCIMELNLSNGLLTQVATDTSNLRILRIVLGKRKRPKALVKNRAALYLNERCLLSNRCKTER